MYTLRFFYFDLGNVLLKFDHQVACRQMADVAGISPAQVREIVFDAPLQSAYERGDLSTREYYELFCERSGTRPNSNDLFHAASDIFDLDEQVASIIAGLRRAGNRAGILSNTCDVHWRFLAEERFPILNTLFEVAALSFRLRCAKPEPAIYHAAAELAGVAPEEVFFVDDRPANVAGALEAGFDAVQFTSPPGLLAELANRGVQVSL